MKPLYYVEMVERKSGWFWRLKHRNGKTLAHSEIYTTKAKATQTILNFVKKLGLRYAWRKENTNE